MRENVRYFVLAITAGFPKFTNEVQHLIKVLLALRQVLSRLESGCDLTHILSGHSLHRGVGQDPTEQAFCFSINDWIPAFAGKTMLVGIVTKKNEITLSFHA